MNPATTVGTTNAPASASTIASIMESASRIHRAERCSSDRIAAALGGTAERWREHEFPRRRETVAVLASSLGMTSALLDESLDALLEPVMIRSLKSLAAKLPRTGCVFGFLMPGNVPGAGIHEVCAALLAGAGLLIKTASSERFFFANFMRTLAEVDATVAERVAVVNFGRGDDAAMRELWAASDGGIVAYGDDASIAALSAAATACRARPLVGFGSRLSGALVVPGASPSAADTVAGGLARDVTLFEQRGCLSPHHVFVVGDASEARDFAARLARALEDLAIRLPTPTRLPLDAAAAIRALRERARWRALAQCPNGVRHSDIALWEGERVIGAFGETPGDGKTECTSDSMPKSMTWTVVYDRAADFSASPGYRTVFVSALRGADELGERLGAAAGRLEAFALSAPLEVRHRLEAGLHLLDVSYVCEPGQMQSPSLDWFHGGGAMFELLRGAA
jgi:Acyl-CoA reductase (LuxC)